jgi:hypothetical protein
MSAVSAIIQKTDITNFVRPMGTATTESAGVKNGTHKHRCRMYSVLFCWFVQAMQYSTAGTFLS